MEIVHTGWWPSDAKRHIAVAEQDAPRRNWIAARCHIHGLQGTVADCAKVNVFRFRRTNEVGTNNRWRKKVMIEQRLDTVKTFQPHHFFAVQAAVRFAELGVPLMRYFAQARVKRHNASSLQMPTLLLLIFKRFK